MKYMVTGRRQELSKGFTESVCWVDSNSVRYSSGISLARKYETLTDAMRGLNAAMRDYKGINWKIEVASFL